LYFKIVTWQLFLNNLFGQAMTSLARQHYNMKQQYTKAPCHTTQHLVGSVPRHDILLRGMAVLCCLAMLLIHQ